MSDNEDNKEPKAVIKQGLRTAVTMANRFLEQAESTARSIEQPATKTWQQASESATQLAAAASQAYDRRHEYAIPFIAGSTVTVGGLTMMRRGRLPGAIAAVLAGGASYGIVYGLDEFDFQKYKPN